MIAYFPEIYEDELVYSWFARYAEKSPFHQYISVAEDLYTNPMTRPDIEFINELNPECKGVIEKMIDLEKLIQEHTMFKYYSRFLPGDRFGKAYDSIMSMNINCKNYMEMKTSPNTNRYLRYCPVCVKQDRLLHAEGYWHKIHQMPEIKVCSLHNCYLVDSNVLCSGKASPSLLSLESVIGDNLIEEKICNNELLCDLTKYVIDVFKAPIIKDGGSDVGAFLHSKLQGTKYCSKRGEQRHLSILVDDVNSFYKDIDEGLSRARIEKIFTNYRYSLYEICKIAYMLEVSSEELVALKMPGKSYMDKFDDKVRELHSNGIGVNKIARELGVSSRTIRMILDGKKEKQSKNYKTTPGVKKKDWNEIDEATLPIVEEIIKKEYELVDPRPSRINCSYICGKLGKHSKYLDKLPKCKQNVIYNQEMMEEYWAREIAWAISKIQKENGVVNWRGIRDLTNLSKENYLRTLSYFENKNKDIYSRIREGKG